MNYGQNCICSYEIWIFKLYWQWRPKWQVLKSKWNFGDQIGNSMTTILGTKMVNLETKTPKKPYKVTLQSHYLFSTKAKITL